jgi:glutaredoxin
MGSEQAITAPRVTFYTKAGCHLCEDARELLDEIATRQNYILTEIDIRGDLAIFEQYRYRIPVILVEDAALVEGRISLQELENAFQSVQRT